MSEQHTPGPLKVVETPTELHLRADPSGLIAIVSWERRDDANAHLLAAAYTSYDKHCGPRAVELAEADLLGQALEVCRRGLAIEMSVTNEQEVELYEGFPDMLRAVLSQLEGGAT